jgi:peptidoglycan/xylan/chitin deacetylase (PgdA/CDA1 family)
MKRLLKQAVQGAVATVAPKFWGRGEPRLLVLMYHRVLPEGHPDRGSEQPGMYVSPETLAMHMNLLGRHFSPIHLEEWCRKAEQKETLPARACAVTFDDGWRDNYQYAWPVLEAAGVPATIFIVSNLVGTHYSFWPNKLARLLAAPRNARESREFADALGASPDSTLANGVAMTPEQIDTAILDCKQRFSDADISALLDRLVQDPSTVTKERDLMDWDEIRAMTTRGQVRIGSHTRRHVRLTPGLPRNAADDEIVGSIAEIEAQLGSRPLSFCYPNGDYSAEATALVSQNYRCAVTTRRGWNDRHSNRHLMSRVGVHDEVSRTPAAFLSRLAGVG